ncbi:MAG: aldolase/citrate lyase family protein, partial [Kineosporiaceae bacterium]
MTNTADDGPGGLGNPWLTGFGPGNGNGAVGRPMRSRRSTLAVPASSPRMIDKARTLSVDEVFLDLEDACAPDAKPQGRRTVIAALTEG